MELSERLKMLIARTDVDSNPLLVANAARMLADAKQLEERWERFARKIDSLEQTGEAGSQTVPQKSQAEWAHEILADGDGPMHYRDIATEMTSRGYRHAREPKNPEKQLGDSVWTAMYEDGRFRKVGRGLFDLAARVD